MKKIFTYSDYRKFIKDFYEFHKLSRGSFSYRYLSEKAGINSSGFYPQVIDGQRDLTNATILKTCIALKLKENEAEYFETLVKFNQAKTISIKNTRFEKLVELKNQNDTANIAESRYDYFSEWYHPAVRELAVMKEFGDDFRKLGRMLEPEITEKQARDSVQLLLRLGFLKQENGSYLQSEPVVTTASDIKSHQLINFQVKMLKLASEAFDRFHFSDPLSNSSTTFGISESTYELIKEKAREFRSESARLASLDEKPEHVYEMNINLFPLTRIKRRNTGK